MKTISLKKVSAVAVASLGFGLLSVVPANAVATNIGNLTVGNSATTPTDGTTTSTKLVVYAAGTPITQTLTVASATAMASTEDFINLAVAVTGPTVAAPTSTSSAITSSVTTGSAITGYTITSPSTNNLKIAYASGTGVTTALAIGSVSFTPTIAGVYTITGTPTCPDTCGTKTAVATAVSVGSNNLVPTVGTSITAINAAIGQSSGQTAFRFQPSSFTKSDAAVSTYFATVDTGTIEEVVVSAAKGSTAAQTPTRAFTNGINNTGGFKLVSTIDAGAAYNNGGTNGTGVAPASWDIVLNGGTATTQVLTIKSLNATTGAITTVATATSTYGAAPALSAANTLKVLNAGAGTTATGSDTTATVVPSTAAGQQFNIVISVKDQYNAALNAQTVSATITGSGLIAAASGTAGGTGNARAASAKASADQVAIGVNADGTSGKGVITISIGTTVIATKTVTFYGAVSALSAKQNHTIASSAGAALGDGSATPGATTIATTAAVIISAKDANGNAVPGLTITAKSSDTAVMSESITINQDSVTTGDYNVQVNSVASTSGKTATLTFRVMSGTTVLATTAALPYTIGGAVATVALSLDKASYAQGSAAVATLTLKDASGNPVFDGDHATTLTAALSTSMSVVKTLAFSTTATSAASLGGKSSVSFNAPASATDAWTISGTTGAGPAVDSAKKLSATASVTDNSAALNTRLDSLNAKIVALTALIAKIMKSLKIK